MSEIIRIKDLSKEFKVLNRREGLKGSIKDLFSRDYRIVKAVDSITMSIEQGEIVGYLGPNGAGKSTTIKMMTGVLEPTSGELLVNGVDPYRERTRNAQEIGVVFGQRSQLWWSLPLVESLKILKDIYQISDSNYNSMIELYKSLVDIEQLLHKPVRQMSLGQRTLSDILAAFLHDPKIVFLDEPTSGVDVEARKQIWHVIRAEARRGMTILVITHNMEEALWCDRQSIMVDGSIKAIGDLRVLVRNGVSPDFDDVFDLITQANL